MTFAVISVVCRDFRLSPWFWLRAWKSAYSVKF